MRFNEIPPVRVFDLGVSFRYLVLRVKAGSEEAVLVRGMNFLPYEPDVEPRIINHTIAELEEYDFQEGRDELASSGGGSAAINPYYQTITLFGADSEDQSEADRDQIAELFKAAFPTHEVSWYSKGHAAEVERKEQEAKAKAKAAREAAKAKKAAAAAAKKKEEAAAKAETEAEEASTDDSESDDSDADSKKASDD